MPIPELTPEQKDSMYLASGSTHKQLALDTAESLGIDLGPMDHRTFENSEIWMRYEESVRMKHVFVIQSMVAVAGKSINDSFVEASLMADTARKASAREVTVVAPHLAYARQDRKNLGRDPLSAAWAIKTLIHSGADRLVAVDIHSSQSQGSSDEPFDLLTASDLIGEALKARVGDNTEEFIVVSPDAGALKANEGYAKLLDTEVTFMSKTRDKANPSLIQPRKVIGDVAGKTCIITDDMIDTAKTLVSAIDALYEAGAKDVIVVATHGIFSGGALERLQQSGASEIMVTDTVPQDDAKEALGDRLTVLPIAPLLAEAIAAIATGTSVSKTFGGNSYS
ncbi:MAG: ribose-phosphate diphosphokinase [Candidatus Microsaccharimonas sp.]